ncbi:MAG TPA: hypothetical protein VLV83_16040 [Acidobacteriota bacterium]|nr:hypothetical protein [Acidobacteriota bacterium]
MKPKRSNHVSMRWGLYALLALFAASSWAVAQLPVEVALFAGQDIEVGTVEVIDNGGTLEVIYTISDMDLNGDGIIESDYWCIQQVHAHVAADASGIPQTRNGSPKPGQFSANEPVACASSYTVSLGPVPLGDFVVAAHAEIDNTPSCQLEGVLYGTEQGTGWIWEIDAVACAATPLIDTGDPAPADNNVNSPNGLAFDAANNTLYFSASGAVSGTPEQPGSELWAADLDTMTVAQVNLNGVNDPLFGHSAGGTFFLGEYWYVANRSDSLYSVDVNGAPPTESPYCDVDGAGASGEYRFGDSAVAPGTTILFASTNGPESTFFSVDLNGCVNFTRLCDDPGNANSGVGECADQQQISYGSNGVLYGHSTGGGDFYVIDTATGLNDSLACDAADIAVNFTDLASGPQCAADQDETAWGAGPRFVDQGNWATYIQVTQP